jgi:ribosomal subunit interface protein
MNITIQDKGFTAKKELIDFIMEKTERLFRIYDKIIHCEVTLKIDRSETKDNKICDIRLIIPGNDLLAGAQCVTLEEAVMISIGALEKQIEKRKRKISE